MKAIYYSMGLFFLFYELGWLISPIEKSKDNIDFRELMKKYKGIEWKDYPIEYQDKLKSKIWVLIHMLFLGLGLFTFQWFIFIAFMAIQFTVVALISNMMKFNIYLYSAWHWINSLFGLIFVLFVIINAYHLHLGLDYFTTLLNLK